ncbi:FMN-binding protein [Aurantibacter sp.]|uniref:FMN-binding protein n=1 Tax=Aurantibacter sp. TaxID=2807103 RepID=UPI00326527E0
MLKVNRKLSILGLLIIATLLISFSIKEIDPRLQKKIDTAILATYEVESKVLKNVIIPAEINDETPASLLENSFFEIYSNEIKIGYLYLGEAPSMKRKFDYIVLFNTDLTIKKSKVLIYREDHGKQIGSQRWLKQFIGLSTDDQPTYGESIDAISGATISASSMTKAMANVLKSVKILKEKQVLKIE